MILITVGTQVPFNRLVLTLDDFYKDKNCKVFAQIGPSQKKPKFIESSPFLSPIEMDKLFKECELIIAHAGTGSIISALKYKKPIVVLPRRASLGEHRNEHQLATVEWAKKLDGVTVAYDENELIEILNSESYEVVSTEYKPYAQEELLSFLKDTIEDD